MESIQYQDLYHAELVKSEKAAYYLRWVIVGLLIGAASLMVAADRFAKALPFTFVLIAVAFAYNALLTILMRKNRLGLHWVRYLSVVIDITLVTLNQHISALYANSFAVATFATLLLYPVFLLYAALRHDSTLMVLATIYTLIVFNLSYIVIYPTMDPELIALVPSSDPIGQGYKSLYIALFGFSLLLVPRTIRALIGKQADLLRDRMEKDVQIRLHKQREELLMENLYRYVSREVAEKLLKDPDLLRGTSVHITAFFVDIRGFTALCASRNPDEILEFLNRFYTSVADAIKKRDGLVNKYLGDSVFAIFGAPDRHDNTERMAIAAAVDVLETMDADRDDFRNRYGVDLRVGIGMESGMALVGNVGSTDRIEYTALGDVVNMASRYEKLNKRFKTRIVFSEGVKNAIDKDEPDMSAGIESAGIEMESLGRHEIRGAEGEHELFTLKRVGRLG